MRQAFTIAASRLSEAGCAGAPAFELARAAVPGAAVIASARPGEHRSKHQQPAVQNPVTKAIQKSGPIQWYMTKLKAAPLFTKQCTSLIGYGFGDLMAQLTTTGTVNPLRVAKLASFGFLVDAPAAHNFYRRLDKTVEPETPANASAVAKKVAIDQLIYAPVFTCCLFIYLQVLAGDIAGIPAVLQNKFVHTMMANWCLWPIAHTINFMYVPTSQRVLYNTTVAILWSSILSYMAHH